MAWRRERPSGEREEERWMEAEQRRKNERRGRCLMFMLIANEREREKEESVCVDVGVLMRREKPVNLLWGWMKLSENGDRDSVGVTGKGREGKEGRKRARARA